MALEHEHLTGQIIGAAIAVHRELGPGLLEAVYGRALAVELHSRGIVFERELAIPILYGAVEVGRHQLDLFVANEIVVELKAIKDVSDAHFAVVRSYLRAARRRHGLILNFAKPLLEVKRVVVSLDPSCLS